jgi:DNA-binding MarR family transcriptional regulator
MDQPGFGMKLKIIANSIDVKFNRRSTAMGLTSSQAHMLGYIVKHKDRAVGFQELETFFNLRHSTITGIIQRLEEKGFVTCIQDDVDRRKKRVEPTTKSLELLQNMYEGRVQVEKELTAGICATDLMEFERVLDQIFANALRENDLQRCPIQTAISQEERR